MATSKVNFVTKEVEVVKKEKVTLKESVTLTLSPMEALVLIHICASIGGQMTSPRKYMETIMNELHKCGFDYLSVPNSELFQQPHHGLYFKDNSMIHFEQALSKDCVN